VTGYGAVEEDGIRGGNFDLENLGIASRGGHHSREEAARAHGVAGFGEVALSNAVVLRAPVVLQNIALISRNGRRAELQAICANLDLDGLGIDADREDGQGSGAELGVMHLGLGGISWLSKKRSFNDGIGRSNGGERGGLPNN